MQPTIRSFDLAHLAHVELLTPKPDESLRFFVDVMGHHRERAPRRLRLPARLGRLRAPHAEAHRRQGRGHGPLRLPRDQPRGAAAARRRHREVRPRQGLDRRRPRPRAGLRLHHARRPHHGDLLRDRVVQAAAGAEARPQEPGAALSRPRRQRAPARPHEPAHLRRRRAAGTSWRTCWACAPPR